MITCDYCNTKPTITDSVLIHKCKKLSLVISDSNVDVIIKKWDRIQKEDTFKNILIDS